MSRFLSRKVVAALTLLLFFALACGSTTTTNTTSKDSTSVSSSTAAVIPATATTEPGKPSATPEPPKPTATQAPPTATAAPKGEAKVEMGDYTHISNSGSLHFAGVVKNNGTATASDIQVVLSLLDDSGSTVGSGDETLTFVQLEPGKQIGFKMSVMSPPDKWAKETFQVQFKTYAAGGLEFMKVAKGLTITGDKLKDGGHSAFSISGQVKNGGDKAVSLAHVIATGYGDDGKIVDVGDTYAKLSEIPAGQSSPFTIDYLGYGAKGKIVKYDLFVTATEK